MSVKDLATSLIGKSAAMLKATPYHQTVLPDYVRAPSTTLSRDLQKQLAPFESAGVRDGQEQLGLRLNDAGKLVDAGNFKGALGQSVAGLKIDVTYEGLGLEHRFELDAQGLATQADFAAPVGQSLFDTLSFTIDLAQNPGFELSDLDYMSLFVEYDFDYRN